MIAEADLTEYDFSTTVPMPFEFAGKHERVAKRLPSWLLAAVKAIARTRGPPSQLFIREVVDNAVRQELGARLASQDI